MEKEKIIIVGAGITGLVLARELCDRFDVTILEARRIAGGRIQTIFHKDFPIPIEAGAEFIHGHLKNTIRLLKEAGIKYEAIEGKMYRKQNGKWKEQEEMIDGWDEMMKKMKKLGHDVNLYDFMLTNFAEEKYAELRRHAIAFAEGFDVADPKKVSTKALYKEWSGAEEQNFRIPAGYGTLVNFLLQYIRAKGCKVIFNEKVKHIHWKKNRVNIQSAADKKYQGTRVFITVPVGILQSETSTFSLTFKPALPQQIQAASHIGFGAVVKIILLFKTPFWKKDSGFIFSEEVIPTWWTQLPNPIPILTGWAGGTQAAWPGKQTKKALLKKALISLANIFDISCEELEKNLQSFHVANWQKNGWSAGAYSYATPETTAARKLLNKPVDGTIFFCGEGFYGGNAPGTVEAGIAHAMEITAGLKATDR